MSSRVGRRFPSFVICAAAVLLIAAKERAVRFTPAGAPPDVSSFSEPSRVVVRHLALDLTVDFEKHALSGTATLDIHNFAGADRLILDTYGLDVHSVTRDGRAPAPFTVGTPTANGAPLIVEIEPATRSVTIDYATAFPRSIVWLAATQTQGGLQPYAYSNNEPIGARSWIPIQDTPTVRMTYDATLRVPGGLLALMTADVNPTAPNDAGIYTFHMSNTVPAYLIAFAVGRIGFRPLDSRTGIYGEPEIVDNAAAILKNIPDVLTPAEALCGPYPWGRYDVLLMPSGYPGGMENPRLNFIAMRAVTDAQPSLLIAHELSHSWAGDMVTLATWNDVWLNEGLASYLQVRFIEPFVPSALIESVWSTRRTQFASYAANASPRETLLHVPLTATDNPNALFGLTPYTKGALFFHTLETMAGRDDFDRFLRAYFIRFAWRPVDDRTFINFLRQSLLDAHPGLEEKLQLEEWLYSPGLPASAFLQAFRDAA